MKSFRPIVKTKPEMERAARNTSFSMPLKYSKENGKLFNSEDSRNIASVCEGLKSA